MSLIFMTMLASCEEVDLFCSDVLIKPCLDLFISFSLIFTNFPK